MINVVKRTLQIPKDEIVIGFTGDNKVETRLFEVSDESLFAFDFKLDVKNLDGSIGIIDLEKSIEGDKITLEWEILQQHIIQCGVIYAQLRAFSGNSEVWHSEIGCFSVLGSINASDYFLSPLPSEFEQIEQRVTLAKNEAVNAKDNVIINADEVAINARTVADNAAIVVTKSAEVSINTLAVAEDTEIAELKAQQASQAVSDLLAMIGNDIATLTGGKLTPSQIPAIAIVNTFVVNSESSMLGLDAQTGDVCIRTDESKSYILQGTNPQLLTNWQHLQTPTNYADAAGHAITADTANNANMVNNHRIVAMTQAEYDTAAKDPETLYMVG